MIAHFPLVKHIFARYIPGMTEAAQMLHAWKAKNDNASNAELARLAGIPTNTVRNVLLGRGATATTIEKLRSVRGLGGLRAEHFVNGSSA